MKPFKSILLLFAISSLCAATFARPQSETISEQKKETTISAGLDQSVDCVQTYVLPIRTMDV